MSLAAIHAVARRKIAQLALPEPAFADLDRVLAANQAPLLQFLLEAALEAGHERGIALDRVAGLSFHLGALQLADDLADGDCNYLEPAVAVGSAAQYLLQNLFVATMIEAGVTADAMREACLYFIHGGAPQHIEVRTRVWTLEQARLLAIGFGGEYMTGNLLLVWAGTSLAARAPAIGRALGVAIHVATEIRSQDPRFVQLRESEQAELRGLARQGLANLREVQLACVARVLRPIVEML